MIAKVMSYPFYWPALLCCCSSATTSKAAAASRRPDGSQVSPSSRAPRRHGLERPFLCPGRRVKVFPQSVPGQGQAAAGALPRTRQRRRTRASSLVIINANNYSAIPSAQGRRYSRQRPERRRQPKQTRGRKQQSSPGFRYVGGRTASDRDDADSQSEQACMLAGRALIRHVIHFLMVSNWRFVGMKVLRILERRVKLKQEIGLTMWHHATVLDGAPAKEGYGRALSSRRPDGSGFEPSPWTGASLALAGTPREGPLLLPPPVRPRTRTSSSNNNTSQPGDPTHIQLPLLLLVSFVFLPGKKGSTRDQAPMAAPQEFLVYQRKIWH